MEKIEGNAGFICPDESADTFRVFCSVIPDSYIEITPGDPNDSSDPCEIEAREFTGDDPIIVRVRPSKEGLAELIQSLQIELQRMQK